MRLYNTLSRSTEDFLPQNKDAVSIYTCGPTVYAYPHLGNWSGYIYWDVLVRALQAEGFKSDWFVNLTDVGHLVSDADDGEDKMEKGARQEGKTAWDVADFYIEDFKAGLKQLNIQLPEDHLVRATEFIDEQVELIKTLEAKGYTYITDDGVYFDSTKFADYGKLARLDIEGLQAGARVTQADKRHPTDFALWKFSPKDQKRDMEWESPWGKGFPGWHLECSAMSMKLLGETLDIHGGGIDHIPVHHTNEIAQSETATGKQFVRYWVHNNHMLIDDRKISKSLDNGVYLADLAKHNFSPLDFRLLVLQSHFRTQSNFTWQLMEAARNRRQSLQNLADLQHQIIDTGTLSDDDLASAKEEISKALTDDLNTPQALAILSKLEDKSSGGSSAAGLGAFVSWIDELLGLGLSQSEDITAEQKRLIHKREAARQQKDFADADVFRDELLSQGITLRDLASTTLWSRKLS